MFFGTYLSYYPDDGNKINRNVGINTGSSLIETNNNIIIIYTIIYYKFIILQLINRRGKLHNYIKFQPQHLPFNLFSIVDERL